MSEAPRDTDPLTKRVATAVNADSALAAVPFGIRVAAAWSGCLLLIAGAIAVFFWATGKLGLVTVSFVVGVMIAALFQPVLVRLIRLGLSRTWAAVVTFLLGSATVSGLVWFVIAQVMNSSGMFASQFNVAASQAKEWLVTGPLHIKDETAALYTTNLFHTMTQSATDLADQAGMFAKIAGAAISAVLLVLFCTLFLMLDDGGAFRWLVRLFPRRAHAYVELAGAAMWRTLVVYMRSLVLLALLNALAMVPVLWIADVPLLVPLIVVVFLGSLIPLVGPLLAAVLLFVVAFIFKGLLTAVIVVVALAIIIQVFGNLINPWLLGKFVELHPIVILLGVTAGTILGGTFGAFAAVPLIAVVNNAVKVMRHHHNTASGDGDELDSLSERGLEQLAEKSL